MTRTLSLVVLMLSLFPAPARAEDGDFDEDGVADEVDNCYAVANGEQSNLDGDPLGDACDGDDDNDGVPDAEDNCATAFDPTSADLDDDALGDACDEDADGDSLVDVVEVELGLDTTSNDSDGDTIADAEELGLELNQGAPLDSDDDGVIDALDDDSDADGRPDDREAGDSDLATPAVDSDGDGVADFRSYDEPVAPPDLHGTVVTGMKPAGPVVITPVEPVRPMGSLPATIPAEDDDSAPAPDELAGCSAAGGRGAGVPAALLLLAAAGMLRALRIGRARRPE